MDHGHFWTRKVNLGDNGKYMVRFLYGDVDIQIVTRLYTIRKLRLT